MSEIRTDTQDDRYTVQTGTRLLVQVPKGDAAKVMDAIVACDPLRWGDYDQVGFTTATGVQQFRSLPGGVNRASEAAVEVPCVEVQVFVPQTGADLDPLLRAIYYVHPYEEPVIQLLAASRTLHIRGQDEGNPNRFWNRADADWVPDVHRSDGGVRAETA
ncbi:hypothetical protein [Pseudophaeobacter sp. A-200-2]|uniref:hypothetical protein n=1 Tax=Pseudophaeobacter sp. A-200-2 TaxID=3098145 RepID=UPI0034D56648